MGLIILFSVWYIAGVSSQDAVVDCWWSRGILRCFIKPGFEYNKIVNTQLAVTKRNVTSVDTGNYAFQIAGKGPTPSGTCQLKSIKNACVIHKEESQSNATLTCDFSEDIGKTQRNFSVVKSHGQVMTEVTKCWWVDGHNHCKFADGYINISRVSANYTVLISEVTTEKEGNYSCWHSGSDIDQETCLLHLSDEEAAKEQSIGILVTVLISTLLSVRKCLCSSKKQTESGDHQQSTPMLKTSLMEKEEEERKVTEDFQEYLETSVKDLYPDITGTFYFVPPAYFNKTRYRKKHVTGEVTWVPDTPADNDVRHDQIMQHVIHCLRHLVERVQEKMFVLTQLTFDAYLNNVGTEYVRHRLPTADSDNSNSVDLLIIHKKHGVLVGVVKAVSDDDVRGQTNQQKADEMIILQIKEGLQQLDEAVCTMNHLTYTRNQLQFEKF